MNISAATRLLTLIGDPVAHSLSPLLHNAALSAQGINMVYVATRVAEGSVKEAMDGFRALGFAGANVTIPHKQAVIPFLDEVTSRARGVGAVNTIVRREGGALVGDNTDIQGFLEPLKPYEQELTERPAVILGAGGAARAVAFALLSGLSASQVTIVARRPSQARTLCRSLEATLDTDRLRGREFSDGAKAIRASALIVNATPVGMVPNTDATPWPDPADYSAEAVVYDLVYNPRRTRFLQEAEQAGVKTIGGLAMLIGQAAASYVQWTGREMPRSVVRETLREQ